jgi:hypothetical protein
LRHLYIKVIFLPRQARDKHRENSQKCRFLQAWRLFQSAGGAAFPPQGITGSSAGVW